MLMLCLFMVKINRASMKIINSNLGQRVRDHHHSSLMAFHFPVTQAYTKCVSTTVLQNMKVVRKDICDPWPRVCKRGVADVALFK